VESTEAGERDGRGLERVQCLPVVQGDLEGPGKGNNYN
jgi:hypothetical protein